jgi:hypothetical protein
VLVADAVIIVASLSPPGFAQGGPQRLALPKVDPQSLAIGLCMLRRGVHSRPWSARPGQRGHVLIKSVKHEAKLRDVRFENKWQSKENVMGRSILLLLLGVPLPIVILLALFWH